MKDLVVPINSVNREYLICDHMIEYGNNTKKSDGTWIKSINFGTGASYTFNCTVREGKYIRDIKDKLFEAYEQLVNKENSIVHVGLYDFVDNSFEKLRYEKNVAYINNFKHNSDNISLIRCHHMRSYDPCGVGEPSVVFDETPITLMEKDKFAELVTFNNLFFSNQKFDGCLWDKNNRINN